MYDHVIYITFFLGGGHRKDPALVFLNHLQEWRRGQTGETMRNELLNKLDEISRTKEWFTVDQYKFLEL